MLFRTSVETPAYGCVPGHHGRSRQRPERPDKCGAAAGPIGLDLEVNRREPFSGQLASVREFLRPWSTECVVRSDVVQSVSSSERGKIATVQRDSSSMIALSGVLQTNIVFVEDLERGSELLGLGRALACMAAGRPIGWTFVSVPPPAWCRPSSLRTRDQPMSRRGAGKMPVATFASDRGAPGCGSTKPHRALTLHYDRPWSGSASTASIPVPSSSSVIRVDSWRRLTCPTILFGSRRCPCREGSSCFRFGRASFCFCFFSEARIPGRTARFHQSSPISLFRAAYRPPPGRAGVEEPRKNGVRRIDEPAAKPTFLRDFFHASTFPLIRTIRSEAAPASPAVAESAGPPASHDRACRPGPDGPRNSYASDRRLSCSVVDEFCHVGNRSRPRLSIQPHGTRSHRLDVPAEPEPTTSWWPLPL